MKLIVNVETNQKILRELNAEELEQQEIDKANSLAAKTITDTEAQTKAAQRQALLTRLGITEEEARLLLG